MGLLAWLKTQFVVHVLIGFVFVVSGLIINFVQLCTLVLWPVNKQLYRRLNCRLAYSLWSREYRPCRAWQGGAYGDGGAQGTSRLLHVGDTGKVLTPKCVTRSNHVTSSHFTVDP